MTVASLAGEPTRARAQRSGRAVEQGGWGRWPGLAILPGLLLLLSCADDDDVEPHVLPEVLQQLGGGHADPSGGCGAALGLDFVEPGGAYRSFLWEAARTGVEHVALVIRWRQRDVESAEPLAAPGITAPLDELRETARAAHAMGLSVMLMPIVTLEELAPGSWRGTLRPADFERWFEAHRRLVLELAELAAEERVAGLIIGSELGAFELHEEAWRSLAADVRERFSGWTGYSANWDHAHVPGWWDAVDRVGISSYFEPRPYGSDAEGWRRRWPEIVAELAERGRVAERPVVVTEFGYRSDRLAWSQPWNHGGAGQAAPVSQAILIDLALEHLLAAEQVERAYLWNWFGHGGPADRSYSPRNKPAMAVVAAHCGGIAGGGVIR